jgi:hypothetical protein
VNALLELDPAEASADVASALNASLAEIARRRYAIISLKAAQAQGSRGESEQGDDASGKDAKDKDGTQPD